MNRFIPSEKIEKMLDNINFSHGRSQAAWEKILPRLNNGAELCADELDSVAGGLQSPDRNNGLDNKDKWKK